MVVMIASGNHGTTYGTDDSQWEPLIMVMVLAVSSLTNTAV